MDARQIEALREQINDQHKVSSIHRETVRVSEHFEEKLIYDGHVEIFEVFGRPDTTLCFACPFKDIGFQMRHIAVLGIDPVDSAIKAVRVALASRARKGFVKRD